MKPYMNINGKGKWGYFWNDKVPMRVRKIFKKSQRRNNKEMSYENS